MENDVQILDPTTPAGAQSVIGHARPIRVNKRTGEVLLSESPIINSQLRKDEWQSLDSQVIEAVRHELRVVNDLRNAGLTQSIGIGTLVSQWNVGTRMTEATVNMTGQTIAERDRLEFDVAGVPVPVISKEFSIGRRQLEASRRLGDALDFTHAVEATRSVTEALENMAVNGVSGLKFNGASLYGYATHPSRVTDTATNFGGGDWGTIANIVPTVEGVISAANSAHFYGPFVMYVSQTQYNQAALSFYDDGSGQRPVDRIQQLGVTQLRPLPAETLADGSGLLIQMTRNVVDWTEAMGVSALEWSSNDNMAINFKIMSIATIRLKANSNGVLGVYHITGM